MNSLGLCECGCGGKTKISPRTKLPRRYILGHHTRLSGVDFIEDPDTHCWIWQLHRMSNGYGTWAIERKKTGLAHRLYYEMLVGPIPDGLTIDHLCRNRACVNPGHLEPVTMRENNLRGNGWSGRNARKTHCIAGHPLSGENLHIGHNGGRWCRACGARRAREARARKRSKA